MLRTGRRAVLICVAAALAAACVSGTDDPGREARQVMEDFSMEQVSAGTRIWTLSSPEARITLKGGAKLSDPEMLFYKEARHVTTARAAEAAVAEDSQDVALRGEVVIVSHQEKTTVRTTRLDYSSKSRRFHTDARVAIERPEAVIRGRGMRADEALSDITIFKQETEFR